MGGETKKRRRDRVWEHLVRRNEERQGVGRNEVVKKMHRCIVTGEVDRDER